MKSAVPLLHLNVGGGRYLWQSSTAGEILFFNGISDLERFLELAKLGRFYAGRRRTQMDAESKSKTGCEKLLAPDTLIRGLKYHSEQVDESFVDVKRVNLKIMAEPRLAPVLLPGEHQDIRVDVNILLDNGNEWLATPNTKFCGRSPQELIGTGDEPLLRESLRSVVYSGMA